MTEILSYTLVSKSAMPPRMRFWTASRIEDHFKRNGIPMWASAAPIPRLIRHRPQRFRVQLWGDQMLLTTKRYLR